MNGLLTGWCHMNDRDEMDDIQAIGIDLHCMDIAFCCYCCQQWRAALRYDGLYYFYNSFSHGVDLETKEPDTFSFKNVSESDDINNPIA